MKKLFVAILAIVGLVACMKDETVRVQGPEPIAFEIGAVDAATRADVAEDPSTTTNSISAFNVWGFMDNTTGQLFVEEEVTKTNGKWGYANTQYWVPEHTYYFAALSNYTNATVDTANANTYGLGTVTFDNAAAQGGEDLLYAATSVAFATGDTVEAVGLTFNHLLSKVKFSFTNGFANDLATLDIKNVKILNAPAKGTIDLAVENWWDNDDWAVEGTTELAFGDACEGLAIGKTQESAKERFTIPAVVAKDAPLQIQFDVTLYYGDVEALAVTKTVELKEAAFQMGKAYNLAAVINADNLDLLPIEFEVIEVKDWVTTATPDDQVYETELHYAAQVGGELKLEKDYVIENAIRVKNNLVVDLNGHEIKYIGDDVLFRAEGKSVTIYGNGGSIVTNPDVLSATGGNGYIGYVSEGGVLNIMDGVYDAQNTCTVAHVKNGTLNIYGGEFKANITNNSTWVDANGEARYLINCTDANYKAGTAVINVYGGKFYMFNPENTAAENPRASFLAAGLKTIKDGDYYVVVADNIDKVAQTDEALVEALAQGGNIALANDVTSDGPLGVNGGLLDGNGYTINANSGSAAYESGVNVSEGTLANVTVAGAFRALGVGGSGAHKMTGDAYYKNVTTVGATYGFNIGLGNGHKLFVEDCTVGDWNSYSGLSEATFVNCTFISANKYYASQRISAGATFTYKNCTFQQNVYNNANGTDNYYLNSYSGTGTIVFENCYMDGVKVTAENVATLFQIADVTVVVK